MAVGAVGERDPIEEAQDLALEAEYLLKTGEARRAGDLLERARGLDPDCIEALLLEAETAEAPRAEQSCRRALNVARLRLGGDDPARHVWWMDTATRPYMRARRQLAEALWMQGRYREAAEECRALLERNPRDNQGVRFLIGPLLLLAGDLEAAVAEFEAYALRYNDGLHDPHHVFTWGLALLRAGRTGEALSLWRRGFFTNRYLAPAILGRPFERKDVWHFSNLEEPEYAREYPPQFGRLWTEAPQARDLLQRAWDDAETRADMDEFTRLGGELMKRKTPEAREKRLAPMRRIERSVGSPEFYARLGAAPPAVDPMHPPGQLKEPPPGPGEQAAPEPEGRTPYREACASGAFDEMLGRVGEGVGEFMVWVDRVVKTFSFSSEEQVREAIDRTMLAWNRGRSRKMGEAAGGEDPCVTMDAGFEAFRRGDLGEAVRRWLEVVVVNPALVDRLLGWDDPDVARLAEEHDEMEAWEYMNGRWWRLWKKAPEAWTALVVLWCQDEVQEQAGSKERCLPDARELAGRVGRFLSDPGPVGDLWRSIAEQQFAQVTFLRDLDRRHVVKEDLNREALEHLAVGMAGVNAMALAMGLETPDEQQARRSLRKIEEMRIPLSGLREAVLRRPGRGARAGRNDPCICGSGRKFKKCCGRR
jgi:tetratricopeptide (TPR) repeat protein